MSQDIDRVTQDPWLLRNQQKKQSWIEQDLFFDHW